MTYTRPRPRLSLSCALLCVVLGGCDANEAGGADEDGKVQAAPQPADGDGTAKGAAPAGGGTKAEPQFDPDNDRALRKELCESFSADMVAKHFDVASEQLKKISLAGCTYSWNDDVTTIEVSVIMPRVHESLDAAKSWYEGATETKSKEQLDAEFEEFEKRVDESEKIDTKVKKDTAAKLSGIARSATPDTGVVYEDLPAIGSQARVSSTDGALWIRTGNLTFQLRAYKGPVKPKVPLDLKNPQAMAKAGSPKHLVGQKREDMGGVGLDAAAA